MFTSILAVVAAITFNSGDYESAYALSVTLPPSNQVYFIRMVSAHQLRKAKEASEAADELLGAFSGVPSRYSTMANLIKEDIADWKPAGLNPIARKMTETKNRLRLAQGGQKTQSLQKEIVSDLDKMIEQAQKKEDSSSPSQEKASEPRRSDSSQVPIEPASEGKVDDKKLREVAENWGKMPPKERERIKDELVRQTPAKYRQMVEEYFAALNRSK